MTPGSNSKGTAELARGARSREVFLQLRKLPGRLIFVRCRTTPYLHATVTRSSKAFRGQLCISNDGSSISPLGIITLTKLFDQGRHRSGLVRPDLFEVMQESYMILGEAVGREALEKI